MYIILAIGLEMIAAAEAVCICKYIKKHNI